MFRSKNIIIINDRLAIMLCRIHYYINKTKSQCTHITWRVGISTAIDLRELVRLFSKQFSHTAGAPNIRPVDMRLCTGTYYAYALRTEHVYDY